MNPRWWIVRSALTLLCVSAAVGCSDVGDLPRDSQTVGGTTIYLGVVPSAVVRDHPTRKGDASALHGGVSEGLSLHHIVVALFEASTGKRISDAQVRAGVGDLSYNHVPDRDLEPMLDNGVISYGGFFPMQGRDPYRIHLEIRRAGTTRPIEAQFVYEHPDA